MNGIPRQFKWSPVKISGAQVPTGYRYRAELQSDLAISLATFFHDYDDLRSVEPPDFTSGPSVIANGMEEKSYGAEWSADYRVRKWWRVRVCYPEQRVSSRPKPGSLDRTSTRSQALDPSRKATARSSRDALNLACGAWRAVAAIILSFALLAGGSPGAHAQGTNPREYQIKAIFIFNFIQFAEWPAAAFADVSDPIRVGVLGDDEPLAGALQAAVEGEKIRQRALVIRRGQRIQDLRDCHVVFVCRSERGQVPAIVAACSGRPVLTVADVPDFARHGGMINFYMEGQKVRFEINRAAAQQSGLRLSSQLLGLARLVGPAVAGGGG